MQIQQKTKRRMPHPGSSRSERGVKTTKTWMRHIFPYRLPTLCPSTFGTVGENITPTQDECRSLRATHRCELSVSPFPRPLHRHVKNNLVNSTPRKPFQSSHTQIPLDPHSPQDFGPRLLLPVFFAVLPFTPDPVLGVFSLDSKSAIPRDPPCRGEV